jgi:hypothetical protein
VGEKGTLHNDRPRATSGGDREILTIANLWEISLELQHEVKFLVIYGEKPWGHNVCFIGVMDTKTKRWREKRERSQAKVAGRNKMK